jgi:metal transporter CNNM
MGDSSDSSSDEEDGGSVGKRSKRKEKNALSDGTLEEDRCPPETPYDGAKRGRSPGKRTSETKPGDLEMGIVNQKQTKNRNSFQLPRVLGPGLEQSMPADAVLAKEGAEELLQSLDPAVAPLGIITLEDVLEGVSYPLSIICFTYSTRS